MKQKVKLLLLLVLFSNAVQGQSLDTSTMFNQNLESSSLDSLRLKVHFHKNQFALLKEYMQFHVYSDTIIDSTGIKRIGLRIADPHYNFDSIQVGDWRAYYANGQLKSTEKFSIGAYTWCQSFGPTISGYSFKNGEASYYDSSGHLIAYGVFAIELYEFQNSCGGDATFHSKTDSLWRYYDEKGNSIEATTELIQEIERK